MNIFYVLSVGVAVSLDALAAGMAYGLKSIVIPFKSLLTVGIVTGVCTAVSMAAAQVLGQYIDTQIAVIAGSLLLIVIGTFSLFQEYLTRNVEICQFDGKVAPPKLTFAVGKLVVSIMARPESADIDHSQTISPAEAFFLGLALGLDNMVATFGATLMSLLPIYTPVVMGLIQMVFIVAGIQAADKFVSEEMKKKFPFLPGAILIVMGLLRIRT